MTEKEVFDWLAQVQHPGKDDKDIVSLGMVEEVIIDGGKVTVTLGFGKRPDPLKNYLVGAEHGLTGVGGADEDHVADFVSSVAFHCNDIGLLF